MRQITFSSAEFLEKAFFHPVQIQQWQLHPEVSKRPEHKRLHSCSSVCNSNASPFYFKSCINTLKWPLIVQTLVPDWGSWSKSHWSQEKSPLGSCRLWVQLIVYDTRRSKTPKCFRWSLIHLHERLWWCGICKADILALWSQRLYSCSRRYFISCEDSAMHSLTHK